jgi:hypothetical protein
MKKRMEDYINGFNVEKTKNDLNDLQNQLADEILIIQLSLLDKMDEDIEKQVIKQLNESLSTLDEELYR